MLIFPNLNPQNPLKNLRDLNKISLPKSQWILVYPNNRVYSFYPSYWSNFVKKNFSQLDIMKIVLCVFLLLFIIIHAQLIKPIANDDQLTKNKFNQRTVVQLEEIVL